MTRVENSANELDSRAPRSDSLANHCVLVTRPHHQQAELISAFESHGAQTIALPLLQIAPPSTGEHAASLRRSLLELDLFDTLIFISTNAVRAGVAAIEDYWPQFPVGIRIVAIGPTTAALAQESLCCEVTIAAGGVTSEDLLSSGVFDNLKGKRVGIFRGEGGRDTLAEGIRDRGGRVDYFEVYRRLSCDYTQGELEAALSGKIPTALTATSGESLAALLALAPRLEALIGDRATIVSRPERRAADTPNTHSPLAMPLLAMPLIVPSDRVKGLALALGFVQPVDAGGADASAFVRALARTAAGQDSHNGPD
jgi:uroporphyrinogen-III synthase